MKLTDKNKKLWASWIIGIAFACIIIFLVFQNIGAVAGALRKVLSLVSPLLLGLAFAMIINVPMRFFERHLFKKSKYKKVQMLRRLLSFLISFILIIGAISGIIWLVIPELINALTVIIESIISFTNKIKEMDSSDIKSLPFGKYLLSINWNEILTDVQDWLKSEGTSIMSSAFSTIGSLISGIFNSFIALVFSIYILFNKDKLKKQAKRLIRAWIPKGPGSFVIHATKVANRNFSNFVSGQSIEALILGSLCIIGMLILRLPYAPMIGTLVGATAIIPVVGAFIGGAVGTFMILTVSPIKAVIFLVFLIVLQQVEGNVIYPKVMGNRVNLPGMWILAAVTVGGGIAGPLGMLLSVPLFSTAYVLIKEATIIKESKNAQKKLQAVEPEKSE